MIGVALVAAVLAVAVLRRWRLALVFAVALVGELAIFLTTTAVIDRPRPNPDHSHNQRHVNATSRPPVPASSRPDDQA